MSFRVEILHSAKSDLKEIKPYLTRQFSAASWQQTYDSLKQALRRIETQPYAGSMPEEIERLNLSQYRQVVCGMNRIIYEVRDKTIYVHIIAETRKNLQSLLLKSLIQ
ncbi:MULTISPECIES: type II toxin-antitoxin system RelE/ParE family toxin [unclassified Pseudomonas]|uniref:type II toxin-antitoxin system RelE/ParE family toxin n=1 Tax=unclassified Pseudomonas TaxID=196821 RepID=UPI00159FFF2A|nr:MULTISPECIES: type II toxin-antitoxin system RelE/ParE family toxin [unclassified Pseudomonas]NWC94619.1 type II toxin-antitoxin system RelE/ParE family toxin [Pseudomonas sp. IPO3779]NWD15756.1 type II toxin-antitoxin system RelE/ParE family toxin [Pseudomonas sp. IPO3778]